MIDVATGKKILVSNLGNFGPYIHISTQCLNNVCDLFDTNNIKYIVDEDAITINDSPEETVINLGIGVDPDFIQDILNNDTFGEKSVYVHCDHIDSGRTAILLRAVEILKANNDNTLKGTSVVFV